MRRLAVLMLSVVLLAAACSSAGDQAMTAGSEATGPGVRVVGVEDAAELLAADPAPVLVDVRTPGEFEQAHIEGALLIDYNAPDFEQRVADLDPEAEYVIYCRSGNRSAGAREIMTDLGFRDVADIEGGIVNWLDAGQPVVPG